MVGIVGNIINMNWDPKRAVLKSETLIIFLVYMTEHIWRNHTLGLFSSFMFSCVWCKNPDFLNTNKSDAQHISYLYHTSRHVFTGVILLCSERAGTALISVKHRKKDLINNHYGHREQTLETKRKTAGVTDKWEGRKSPDVYLRGESEVARAT